MICPKCAVQMVNYIEETKKSSGSSTAVEQETVIVPLPCGGVAEDSYYETWYEYACPACDRRVRESYKCEVLITPKKV